MGESGSLTEPHPLFPLPTREQVEALFAKYGKEEGEKRFLNILTRRREAIDAERADPFNNVYEPFCWKEADRLLMEECDELLVQGGNRSGKTEWAASRVNRLIAAKPGSIAWCLHTTANSSIEMQQPAMYRHIPLQWKNLPRSKVTNINFSMKNGFADNKFILPNGSQCIFKNYSQDIKVIEGGEPDIIWCDELVPMNWVETLRYRLVTRKGKLIITFTPIYGMNAVVKDYVAGAAIHKSLPVDYIQPDLGKSRKVEPLLSPDQIHVNGCPKGHMPYVLKCRRDVARVIYFFTQWNPYSPYDEMVKKCRGESTVEVKKRAFGWAENLIGSQFPLFGDHNIVPWDKIPPKGTNYMVVDPAGARNWFMLWARVAKGADDRPMVFIYREWPDQSYGEWALPCEKADGRKGPAQTSGAGMGVGQYKKLILSLEGGEEITTRYIDPRAAAQAVMAEEQGTSLLDMLADEKYGPSMFFVPSAGKHLDETVGLINNWLAYNPHEPITALNQPQLYVWEGCKNLIFSMREWTGADGDKGATKDPIDCLRYLAVEDIDYVEPGRTVCKPLGSY